MLDNGALFLLTTGTLMKLLLHVGSLASRLLVSYNTYVHVRVADPMGPRGISYLFSYLFFLQVLLRDNSPEVMLPL